MRETPESSSPPVPQEETEQRQRPANQDAGFRRTLELQGPVSGFLPPEL